MSYIMLILLIICIAIVGWANYYSICQTASSLVKQYKDEQPRLTAGVKKASFKHHLRTTTALCPR